MIPASSKIRTYIAKIKIWLVSQLDWTKFDTEQLQVTGKADDNASLLLLKSKMVLIVFLRKVGYGASVAVLALIMLLLPLIFSGPAQNSDTVQKSIALHFKYFRFQVSSSVGYNVQPLRGHLSTCYTFVCDLCPEILLKAELLHHWMLWGALSSCISTQPICTK